MGTRCGDIDPAIIPYIINKYPDMKDPEALNIMMNKKRTSGNIRFIG